MVAAFSMDAQVAYSVTILLIMASKRSATQRIFGLCATAGERAGARRVSFACRAQTMTRLSRTSRLQMAWHASHIQRLRPLEASAAFCSIHLTRQASPLATRQLSYKKDSESSPLVPFAWTFAYNVP